MFQLLYPLINAIQPYLVPLCFGIAWIFIMMLGWSIWSSLRDGVANTKRMHQIPCTKCQFFTGDYRLKCTVRPSIANTEGAINCSDYCSRKNYINLT